VEELTQIITQVYDQLYKDVKITPAQLRSLAENAKFNPRTGINLLEFFVVDPNLENVLKTCCIVKDGLTLTDVKILEFLASQPKPVGANAIAMKCGMSVNEYQNEWESFLYEFGYLDRLPSRVITAKGKEILQTIKQEVGK
jgi:Holliday junction resolvasome RuvABC ATP-dependent DNA helicase subunit